MPGEDRRVLAKKFLQLLNWNKKQMRWNDRHGTKPTPKFYESWRDWFERGVLGELGIDEHIEQMAKDLRDNPKDERRVPSYAELIQYCSRNMDNASAQAVLKFTGNLPDHQLSGGGWTTAVKRTLSLLRDYLGDDYIKELVPR
jgi:hypothetical protein